MEEPLLSWSSFVGVLLLLLAVLLLRRRRCSTRKQYNLPPGPRPWPVIGNLNLIGPLPHRSLHELSARYGPLMSLQLGSYPAVVGSSVAMARFFLKTHDVAFLDRPRLSTGRHIFYGCSDILWAPYGAYWRQARKLCQTELLSARQLRSTEHVRDEEVHAAVRGLCAVAASSAGGVVVLKDHLAMVSLGVISRVALGRKYVVEGGSSPVAPDEFRWMVDELFLVGGLIGIGDFIPWMEWMDLQGYVKRMKKLRKMLDQLLDHVVDEHGERRRREGEGFVPRDMVDLLLQLADDPSLEVPIERDGVKAFTLDLIAAGTDTSAVTVEWALSELLRKPEAIAKATEELDSVVGRDRFVTEQDIPRLPYLEAIVKETMRLHPAGPLLAPRLSREDTSVGGHYDIPAGTRVLVNVWAIGRDPAVWGDAAEEFRPERFVGSDVDVKGHDFELLPFGAGRRMCPGYALGLKMVQLTLANLLHAFAWRLPDGVVAEELSMEEKYGMSMPRMVPLEAVIEPRLPAHLYDDDGP
ncbi:hypothetical protein HU200_023375 [Digitaria exilis]|uniref:Cytochrome P450 n=1 Tax=Digitaria exilis TaxID=1010633 RepID=A0A835C3Q9_9POAL|nr:hypothetical protein HU200_023375 [Digitaria exilis]